MFVLAEEAAKGPTWGFLADGMGFGFLFLVVFVGIVWLMISRARAGLAIPEIRKIAGLDAMDEAIGRATEMGRPVHFSPGIAQTTNPQTIASYAVLSYVARTCAQYDTRIIVSNRQTLVYAINEEVVRQAYLEAGRPDAFNPDDVRFLSEAQFAYTAATVGILEREKPAANILYGAFWAESMILVEQGALIGAIQIGATANTHQLPFIVAGCDYSLIGEEMYAASAYISKEPVLRGTVAGQDWGKIIVTVLILLGVILTNTAGSGHFLETLLNT
jgi:hypothetical protein